MASDLKSEIFACTLFYKTWILKDLLTYKPNIFQIFGDECCKVENISEACDDMFIVLIVCRRKVFKSIYLADFTDEKAKSLTSLMKCYNYVSSKCDYLFGGLTVFERVFATFSFVLDFCARIYDYNRPNIIEYGYMFWAIYFDKFTEEFYLGGGWPRLKELAKAYCEVVSFIYFFDNESVFKLKEATENYFDFKNSDHYEEHKRNGKENVSKLWIKFRKKRFENYIRIRTTDQYFSTAFEVEDLLNSLKNILGICLKESIPFTDRECSEIHTDHADNKINTNDAIGIRHFPERNCETSIANHMYQNSSNRYSPPCNVPDANLFCSEIERASGNEKLNLVTCLEARSSKNENDLRETNSRKEMIPTSRMSEADYNEKISTCILRTSQFIDLYIDELFSRNMKIEETPNALDVLSTSQIRESFIDEKLSSCRVPEVTHLCSQSDSNGREVNKSLEATNSENGDNQTEYSKRTTMQFTSQISSSESHENSHILRTRQFLEEYIDKLYLRKTTIEETPNTSDLLSTNQVQNSSHDITLFPCRITAAKNLCSLNESNCEANKTLEAAHCLKNGDNQIEIAETKVMQFTSQISKSESYENSPFCPTRQIIEEYIDELHSRKTIEKTSSVPGCLATIQVAEFEKDGNTTSDTLPTLKVSSPGNGCECTVDEIKKIDWTQEDLKNKQEDRIFKFFLRMILVLNDRQGTKSVYQELQNIEGDSQKIEVIQNKTKKRSKKKSKNKETV